MKRRLVLLTVAVLTPLAACGSDESASSDTSTADTTAAETTAPADTAAPTTEAPAESADTTMVDDTMVESAGAAATTYPLTIDNCGRDLTFDGPPERVVILNGTSVAEVESFVALGIEDSIVANGQSYGVYDAEGMADKIAAIPTGGVTMNENFEIPREQTLAQEPDLVVSTWAGGFSQDMGSVTPDELAGLGINAFVTPVNCSYGATDPRPDDVEKWENQTYEASFELLEQLGVIFDVQDRAAEVIAEQRAKIEAATVTPSGDPLKVLIAYPGMSMMNANGLPAVFGGAFYDSIIDAAGGVNAFPGMDFTDMGSINAEQLAASNPDVVVIGLFQPGEDPALYAEQLFAQFPDWPASKSATYTSVSDSMYLGPNNAIAIEKIAAAIATLG